MQNNNKLRVGILGCANIAIRFLAPAFAEHPNFELVAFAGRNADKTKATADKFSCEAIDGYQSLIERTDIDMVYVPLPNALHKEWCIKALQSGKHVLCEKSIGCTPEEVADIIATARQHNRLVIENFQFRFHFQHQWVKQQLATGVLGEIRCFRSSFGFPPFADANNIRYSKVLGGGALLDAGAYTLKALQFMLGGDFRVKAATLWQPDTAEVDLAGGIYLDNAQGIMAELAFGFDHFYQCNYELWGSKGKLTCHRAFTAPPGFAPTVTVEYQGDQKTITLPADNHFQNMLTHFYNTVQSGDFEDEYQQILQQANYVGAARQAALKL